MRVWEDCGVSRALSRLLKPHRRLHEFIRQSFGDFGGGYPLRRENGATSKRYGQRGIFFGDVLRSQRDFLANYPHFNGFRASGYGQRRADGYYLTDHTRFRFFHFAWGGAYLFVYPPRKKG